MRGSELRNVDGFLLPPIETWADWTSVFNDVSLWTPVIDLICAREGIEYRSIEIPRSNTNAVFILDRRVVVKIYSPFWREFDFERRLIEVLENRGDVPVPRPLAAGSIRDRTDWDYLILEFREGRTLRSLAQESCVVDVKSLAAEIGVLVRKLHETDVCLVSYAATGERWDALVARRRGSVLAELVERRVIASDLSDALGQIMDDAIAEAEGAAPVIVHGDLESDHLLFHRTESGWSVNAMIDFGDARIGVRDYEWMPLWLGLFDRDADAMRAFLGTYDPSLTRDPLWGRRVAAWTLLHDFGTDAVAEVFESSGASAPVESLDDLRGLLWPGLDVFG